MLFYIIILHILVKATFTNGNAGTAIFYNRQGSTDCWNDDDILKLRARKSFEKLIPHINPDEVNVKYTKDVLRYFRSVLYSENKEPDPHTSILLKETVADTIGAHLRNEILPTVRFAYYAGYVPYRNARQLHDLFDDIKVYLNTQGLGWNKPVKTKKKWTNLTVSKILIGAAPSLDPCSCLVTKRDSDSCIHLPIPKLDDRRDPSAVALPFKSGGLLSLTAPGSNNVLLKYYTTAARCILSSSPEKCRHSDFVSFNNQLWHWMKRDVAPHLMDEKLYAAYGGILRVAAAVQNYGRGLSRRNLFENQEGSLTKWNPWNTLTHTYLYVNADWTPKVYVGLVLLTGFSIYLIQICYIYICGEAGGCACRGRSRTLFSRDVAYDNVDTALPALLPQQSAIYYGDRKHLHNTSQTKCPSAGSVRTQKVYDLNENTETIMTVIMSDNEVSTAESSSVESSAEEGHDNVIDVGHMQRSKSPPKLQTSISQLTVNRTARADSGGMPMYSTSTVTRPRPERAYRGRNASDSVWSATESTTSSRSRSSTTSKSRRSRSRCSRDLAWARRVVSKHTTRSVTKSTPRTELDINSYTTQTSQR